ncbi:hypothetical protein UFOVP569_27 [uncultured Caudovirales phage]|uniref:Uncharacterized protein n=1 Tax=uncultured Caudovirales phage TaxID=2100421 RepID=A0A6J5MVQ2_9CAUD|nr:hypothetical protein UFOVP569_27 [uncultured Caudovirales phage]CAB4182923.1 hypothetical protein UFOVP1093_24 [uncultured Caudovirales phage]CAB4200008.1 hypothetical protein UFOVP1340_23 [uncultured Caudovirales phage]CAB4213595.1 hypothetical protein UFOVP1448_55 [uncultured Caudovirales phage]CAB4218624.1 hypothetical protein UFOVP1600_26 [uncultured Caudovirales phage]
MNTSLRFDSGYCAWIDSTTDPLFIARKDESFFSTENLPACYKEIRTLAARSLRTHRITGQQIFSISHAGFAAIVSIEADGILVDTSVTDFYIGNFWFAIN